MPARRRYFYAFWPDDATRLRLEHVADRVAPHGCRRVRTENLHLTLVFVGAVTNAQLPALEACVREVPMAPMTLVFDRTGHFPRASVAWLGVSAPPPALATFQAALRDAVAAQGFEVDTRAYTPHLTVARPCRTAPDPWPDAPLTWAVDRFALCRSDPTPDGVRYRVVAVSPPVSMR